MWNTFLAIARKEFLHFLRNKAMLRVVLFMQGLQVVSLGFIDMTARDLPTVVVDQDQSSFSRELVQKLRATKTFDIRFTTSSIEQGREHVRAGRTKVALVIPPDFHRDRASHRTARIMALVDGSDSVSSGQAIAAINGMAAQIAVVEEGTASDAVIAQRGAAVPIEPHSILLFNPTGETSIFMLPALCAFILGNLYMALSASALVREREQGTLERLIMTPMSFTGFMLGKLAPYLVIGLVNAAGLLLLMSVVFHVPIRGSLLLLYAALSLYLLTMLALGVYQAAGASSAQELGMRQGFLTFPILYLSGYLFPLSSIPKWLLPVSYALPPTHMIEIMRGLALRGAGVEHLWTHLLFMVVAPAILLTLAVRKFKSTINS
ncbi:MAG TPA: ABC transporter permease [Labilithrix sp.]|nr:ABC transporter permease [Labilithrix sp.]